MADNSQETNKPTNPKGPANEKDPQSDYENTNKTEEYITF